MSGQGQGLDQAALRRLLGNEAVQALLARLRQPSPAAAPGQESGLGGGQGGGTALPGSAAELEQALGQAAVQRLEQASGMPRQVLLETLAALLPALLDRPADGDPTTIPGHPGPGFGYGGAPPGQERDPAG